jgi:hypothetical protein
VDNQHRKLSGYRELTQDEINLINEIKGHEQVTLAIIGRVRGAALLVASEELVDGETEPLRWTRLSKDYLQMGIMALIRAVAQPGS